jgi:hypothetical protein
LIYVWLNSATQCGHKCGHKCGVKCGVNAGQAR